MPRLRAFKFLAVSAGALTVVCGLVVLMRGSSGPRWQGRALSSWLGVLQSTNMADRGEAETALHAIGTNAFPTLNRWLTRRDSPVVKRMDQVVGKIGLARPYSWTESSYRSKALCGFRALGTNGQAAVPYLRRLMSDPATTKDAAFALVWVAPLEADSLAESWIKGTNVVMQVLGLRMKQEIIDRGVDDSQR